MSDYIPSISDSLDYIDTSDFTTPVRKNGAPRLEPYGLSTQHVSTILSYEKVKEIILLILDYFKSSYKMDPDAISSYDQISSVVPEANEVLASLGFGKDKFPYVKFSYEFNEEYSKYVVFCESTRETEIYEHIEPAIFLRFYSKCEFEVNIYQTQDEQTRIVEVNRLWKHSPTYIHVFQSIKKAIEDTI